MRTNSSIFLGLAVLLCGCPVIDKELAESKTQESNSQVENLDVDEDGYRVGDGDCDDENPAINPGATDNVGDGEDQNCDGIDGTDGDGDGYAALESGGTDCDDSDPVGTLVTEDADCDGVLTAEDCDDADVALLGVSGDSDCDGVLMADDCDDADPSLFAVSGDEDCDGVLTGDDCDDVDASLLELNNDTDCDGVLSGDDCDDGDANTINDMDCDGVLSGDDCDDTDSTMLALSNDSDCDGVLTADDCDDTDATTVNDMDCDGVTTANDCDDGDAATIDDMDCDGTPAAVDCNDTDPSLNDDDLDGDGYGTCDGDCDDNDILFNPGAVDTHGDSVDSDCDGMDCEADTIGSVRYAVCHDTNNQDFTDAVTACESAGYDGLGAILSETENDYVKTLRFETMYLFIGLNDRGGSGWEWQTGQPVSYTDWGSGEPSDSDEHCVKLFSASHGNFQVRDRWGDGYCHSGASQYFLCERR